MPHFRTAIDPMKVFIMLTKLRYYAFAFVFIVILTGLNTRNASYKLVGRWESIEKNLIIEMFEDNGQFSGKMIYFKCSTEDVMRSSKDTENPDENLRTRNLLGLKLVTELDYQGEDVWDDGKIYDPNSGHEFDARIELTGPNTAVVRGYWKYRWLGRSMRFNRLQ